MDIKEKTLKRIEVMQDFVEGYVIEGRSLTGPTEGTWKPVENPSWNWSDAEFRVAEEEMGSYVRWVNVYSDGVLGRFHETREEAVKAARDMDVRTIKMVEVDEDE